MASFHNVARLSESCRRTRFSAHINTSLCTLESKNELSVVQVNVVGRWSCVRSALLPLRVLIACCFLSYLRTLLTNDRIQRKVMGMGYLVMRGSSTCLTSGPHTDIC